MKKVKADRYQKQRSPEPDQIDFSGPAIGSKPSNQSLPAQKTETRSGHADERTNARPGVRTNERTIERTNERTDKRRGDEGGTHNTYLIAVPSDRVTVRHSFDVFEDQKLALDRLQMAIRDATGEKPNLGEMVQKALDDFIQRRTRELPNVQPLNRAFERTNERTDEHTFGRRHVR